jgi:hypothetical protein
MRSFVLARGTVTGEVTLLLIDWATGQYPHLTVNDITYQDAAASHAMLKVILIVFAVALTSRFGFKGDGSGRRCDRINSQWLIDSGSNCAVKCLAV